MPSKKNYVRKYERYRYPIDYRPTITICGFEYRVQDISTRGVNIIVPHDHVFVIHQQVPARFMLNDGQVVELTGTLSILPPRYTLVFSHKYHKSLTAPVQLEVNGVTFTDVNPAIKNIPLYINEEEINKFSALLPPVRAMVLFDDGEEIPVEGTIVRVKQRGTALHLLHDISPERIQKEQQFIQAHSFRKTEDTYEQKISLKISKKPSLPSEGR